MDNARFVTKRNILARASHRDGWDNGGPSENGPGRRANAVIPGPRRTTEVRLMADYAPPDVPASPPTRDEPAHISECVADVLVALLDREGR